MRRRNRRLRWRIRRLRIRLWQWTKSLPNSTAFWLALVAIVLVCSVVLPAARWDWLRSGVGENATESNSTTIRNIGFLIAGVLALVFAVWRGVLAQRQAETAQRQSETSQQGLLNERYQKGAEMLDSEVLSVRLGGIYALQRLAEEHPEQYHVQIMELFCAFVRFPTDDTRVSLHSEIDDEQGEHRLIIRPDVQDVMRAIGLRNSNYIRLERRKTFRPYLRDANVSYLQTADVNLSRAWLTNANLSYAELRRADLSGARLHHANLSESDLWNANLSRARLDNANLFHARLWRANLSDASLNDANLSGSRLHNANLSDASLNRASLSRAYLHNVNLSRARLAGADLTGVDLESAILTDASFNRRGRRGDRQSPAMGLTQAQLDVARSDPDNPPDLEGVFDAETGEQLVWQGRPLDDNSADPDP